MRKKRNNVKIIKMLIIGVLVILSVFSGTGFCEEDDYVTPCEDDSSHISNDVGPY
ncbi:hypothetical protein [Proteiniborus sp.]|uniref:hypothetical protein n=1 Tax=Proteiniborus sp. TaxID=2079015 RepID=UPI00332A93A6